MKKTLLGLLVLFLIVLFSLSAYLYKLQNKSMEPTSYESCIAIKNSKKMKTNPPTCVSPKGKTFTQSVTAVVPPVAPKVDPVNIASVSALLDSKDNPVKLKTVSGTLVHGNEIDRGYCPSGIYLKDDTGKIQLRVKGADNALAFYKDDTNLGKRVELTGDYPDAEAMCEALTCDCEDYIVVQQIELMEVPNQ